MNISVFTRLVANSRHVYCLQGPKDLHLFLSLCVVMRDRSITSSARTLFNSFACLSVREMDQVTPDQEPLNFSGR